MGGKSSTQESYSENQIDPEVRSIAADNMNLGRLLASGEHVPNRAVQVADFTDSERAASRNLGAAARAFGLTPTSLGSSMPKPETTSGGIRGFSFADAYDDAVAKVPESELARRATFFDMASRPTTPVMPNTRPSGGGGKK